MSYNYLVDSSAWVEYFSGTPKGLKFQEIIEQQKIATSIVAIAELAEKFERDNLSFDAPLQFIQSKAAILALSIDIALRAAKIKKEVCSRNTKFGLADAIHLSMARSVNSVLITTDRNFAGCEHVIII